ncbi:TetR/AcrR family transcriptional regulator [Streptomyces sp. NPDC003456]|uniref:TetR/AcrR family transcriptional regulator n=1 Tax=Streptomyces sp. NPDC003456 TaxID=3364683 RepID=UPI0036A6A883
MIPSKEGAPVTKQAETTARDSLWRRREVRRGGRGERPSGLDRERITAASVRLLDAEGLAGFSMRRLAAELNVTAMSLYWYVDTKDDLLELALDAVYAELRLPEADRTDEDWRGQLRRLAGAYRALLVRHPWLSPLAGRYLNIGPNSLTFARVIQRLVHRAGLPAHGVTGAISAVFQFVYGYGTIESHFLTRIAETGLSPEEYFRQSMTLVDELPGTAEAAGGSGDVMATRAGDTVAEMLDRDFGFALDLLIAGIEALAARS